MSGARSSVEIAVNFVAATVTTAASNAQNSLEGLDTSGLVNMASCWVEETQSLYVYQGTSAVAADGAAVVAPTSGIGRWLRTLQGPIAPAAGAQAAWYVDSVAGSDNNDGSTSATAIQTLDELDRRLDGAVLLQNTTVYLSGDFSSQTLRLRNVVVPIAYTLTIEGQATTLYSGTISAKTDAVKGAAVPTFTDAAIGDVSAYAYKRARLTAGASAGATTWILNALAPTQAEVSQWNIDGQQHNATLDAYVIEELVPIGNIDIHMFGAAKAYNLQCNGGVQWSASGNAIFYGLYGCGLATATGYSILNSTEGYNAGTNGCFVAAGGAVFLGSWGGYCIASAIGANIGAGNGAKINCYYAVLQGQLTIYAGTTILGGDDIAVINSAASPAIWLQQDSVLDVYNGTIWGATSGAIGAQVDAGSQIVLPTGAVGALTGATHDLVVGGNNLTWSAAPIEMSGARVVNNATRSRDALEIGPTLATVAGGTTSNPVAFPAGVTLNGADYVVELVEEQPTGAPVYSPAWVSNKTTTGFTLNVMTDPGGATARNFTARVKN